MNLNQITVGVTNLEESIDFYEKLGLILIVHSSNHYARFECPDGEATFSLQVLDNVIKGNTTIYFELENLDDKVEKLISLYNFTFQEMPSDKSWLWREAILMDPDGNKIKLYHAGENRKNPPWRVN